jgi:UPF0716 protein FxsA
MHPAKAIAIGLLAWPAAEFVAFICVAAAVGFLNAIVLMVIMSAAGVVVLRYSGSGSQRVQTVGGFVAASSWRGEIAPALGGILLLVPGFISGVAGLAILVPLSRRLLLAVVQRLFAASRKASAVPGVVDLAPDEWRPLPADKLPPAGSAPRNNR